MAELSSARRAFWPQGIFARLVARPRFQDLINRTPGLSRIARKDGAVLFDLVQGFVRAQTLSALVELDLPRQLMQGPACAADLTAGTGLSPDRMTLLLQAGAGIGVLKRRRDDSFALTRQGAALCGVPGLQDMIRHHAAFYRDMGDPLALLRGDTDTELAAFWPYVFGNAGKVEPELADRYSHLMTETQSMVARDTLRTVSLKGSNHLMDVGGGSGAFLIETARAYPDLTLTLFDLPNVIPAADRNIAAANIANRITPVGGSFRTDPLPTGADTISLIRVLYDHNDSTVAALLRACFKALPPNGRLIISEPMSGGPRPDPITDVYFAFYTLAMQTGRTRSRGEISSLLTAAGFTDIETPKSKRSYVTSVLTATRPEE